MPPIVHCVRHAQAVHNLSHANHSMPDPDLTTHGEEQCAALKTLFAERQQNSDKIGLVLSSPLRRALRTALIAFEPLLGNGRKVLAWPGIQEASDLPCDTGSTLEAISAEFKGLPVDFSMVEPGWDVKKGKFAASADKLQERAKEARKWLMQRPEEEIVLVCHGCYLHFLTDDWVDSVNSHATSWKNTEFRTYTFANTDGEDPRMVEASSSRVARGLDAAEPTEEERQSVKKSSIQTWIEWGVIREH